MAQTLYPCVFYKVRLDASKRPIPSTMYPSNNAKISDSCREALLPATQMKAPAGKHQCFNGIRYFYKVSNKDGKVLGNSLFEGTHKPVSMCSGSHTILEYIVSGS